MVTGYCWMACVKGLIKAQPGSSAPAVTLWLALSKMIPTKPGLILRQADRVRPSSAIAITATTMRVPRRATGRMGLAARAIAVFLLVLMIRCMLIEVAQRFLGGLVDIAFERSQPA